MNNTKEKLYTYDKKYVQVHGGEEVMRPGHYWLFKFGDEGDGTSCEEKFNLTRRSWEDYKGTRF